MPARQYPLKIGIMRRIKDRQRMNRTLQYAVGDAALDIAGKNGSRPSRPITWREKKMWIWDKSAWAAASLLTIDHLTQHDRLPSRLL